MLARNQGGIGLSYRQFCIIGTGFWESCLGFKFKKFGLIGLSYGPIRVGNRFLSSLKRYTNLGFKPEFVELLSGSGINSKVSNSASLCSLAGRYDNSILSRFLAPIDWYKIPALICKYICSWTRSSESYIDLSTILFDYQTWTGLFYIYSLVNANPAIFLFGPLSTNPLIYNCLVYQVLIIKIPKIR